MSRFVTELPISWAIAGEMLTGTLVMDHTASSQLRYGKQRGQRTVNLQCTFRVSIPEGKATELDSTALPTVNDQTQVEVLLSADGSTFSECHSVACETSTTTISDLRDKAAKCGLPFHAQRVVVMPVEAFTTEDITTLRARLHGEITQHTPPVREDVQPIEGFLPPVQQPSTKSVRARMNALLDSFAHQNGQFSASQLTEMTDLCAAARNMLRETKANAPLMKNVHRTVVYKLRSIYREIYSSVHQLVRETEADALNALDTLIQNTQTPNDRPTQTTHNLFDLLRNGYRTKTDLYDPFFSAIANRYPKVRFLDASIKGPWRCIEKLEFQKDSTDSCMGICDVTRGAVCSNSVTSLVSIYEVIQSSDAITIVRVKNRLKEANDSGWADCLINFYFNEDSTRHVCEVQLVHEKLMLVRKNMGAHSSYSFFRAANELLEATDASGTWDEECALVDLHQKCNGDGWVKHLNWCTGAPVSDWQGVTVDETGHVVKLELGSNNMHGVIPNSISRLQHIDTLDLSSNSLVGYFPSAICTIVSLVWLTLSGNQLEGPLPDSIANLQNLKRLDVHGNALSGLLPASICDLHNLIKLDLSGNQFEGQFPSTFENLHSILSIFLRGSNLSVSTEERTRFKRLHPKCYSEF